MSTTPLRLHLPDELREGRQPEELAAHLLKLAVLDAFRRQLLSSAQAARLLHLDRPAFMDLCWREGVDYFQVDPDDALREVDEALSRRRHR